MSEKPLPGLPEQLDTSKLQAAFDAPVPEAREIDASFFSHKNRKSTQLIGNQNGEPIKGRREWLDYDLNDAIFITSIIVTASGYDDHHEMELSFIDSLTSNRNTMRAKFDGNRFSFQPKSFVRGFGLRPDLSWSWSKSQFISSVQVSGIEQDSFHEVVSIFENAQRERSKIETNLSEYMIRAKKSKDEFEANKINISSQEKEIQEKQASIEELNISISSLTEKRDEITKRIEIGISNEKERNERVQSIELDIRTLNGKREHLVDEIASATGYPFCSGTYHI